MFSGFSKWSSLLLWIGFVVLLSSAVWAQVGAATAPPVATSPNLAAEAMKPDDSPSMLRPVLQDMGSLPCAPGADILMAGNPLPGNSRTEALNPSKNSSRSGYWNSCCVTRRNWHLDLDNAVLNGIDY